MFQHERDEMSTYGKNYYETKTDFPFEIRDVDPSINQELLQDYRGERTGFIQVGEKKWFFPVKFGDHLASFYNLTVRPTDVWIVTFPKTGTTVTQEMVWLLSNNLDYEKASRTQLDDRFPFLEANCIFHPDFHAEILRENMHSEDNYKYAEKLTESVCDYLDQMKERRFIKTHLPFSLLPPNLLTAGCKVIYIARNPKDVAVSYYHQSRSMRTRDFSKDFPKFWKNFSNNLVLWAPFWEHVLEAWEKKTEKNYLFLFYENIIKDMKKTIIDVQNFLGTDFTDYQLSRLENHLKIDNFRNNNSVNFKHWETLGIFNKNEEGFIRKGKNGEAKRYFDEHLANEADEWIDQHLKQTDLKFPSLK